MDQTSPIETISNSRVVLEGQIRECFGRVVYSHKTHEKCADLLLKRLGGIKLIQIILSAATTGSFISVFFGSGSFGAFFGTCVSTALLALNAYTKDYDLGELAQKHRQAGADLWLIREEYLSLLTDLRISEITLDSIVTRRNQLLGKLHAVYSGSPSTNYKAYRKAQIALQQLEDMTFSNEEIDAFLPSELKRVNH